MLTHVNLKMSIVKLQDQYFCLRNIWAIFKLYFKDFCLYKKQMGLEVRATGTVGDSESIEKHMTAWLIFMGFVDDKKNWEY